MNLWYEITKTEQIIYIFAAIATAMLFVDIIAFIRGYKDSASNKKEKCMKSFVNLRSFLVLLSVGLWATILTYKLVGNYVYSALIGFGISLIITIVFMLIFGYVSKMDVLSEVDLKSLIGNPAIVYSVIQSKGEGKGKVSVVVNNRMRVFNAIAYEDNKIVAGKNVKVVDVLGSDLLLVERIQEA